MDGVIKHRGFYFRPVQPGDIEHIAANMREADRREVKRWTGASVEYELQRSVALADALFVGVFDDGEIACLFGGKRVNVMDNTGCIWELSTEAVNRHPVTFARASKVGLDLIMKTLPDVQEFENWVDADYESAVKWIEWLGGGFAMKRNVAGRLGGKFLNFYFINPYFEED